MNKRIKRIQAIVLTIVLLVSLIPMNFMGEIYGASSTVTIKLQSGYSDVKVCVTPVDKSSDVQEATTKNGVVTMDIPSITNNYNIVLKRVGYEDVEYNDTYFTESSAYVINDTGVYTALKSYEISGVIRDEKNKVMKDVTVSCSGYSTDSDTTDDNGKYSVTVYEGQSYTLKASKKSDKVEESYSEEVIYTVDKVSSDKKDANYTMGNYHLNIECENATIKNDKQTLLRNTSYTIQIEPDDYYELDKFVINNVDVTKSVTNNKGIYEYKIDNVLQDYNVNVTLKLKNAEIKFMVGDNGKITDTKNHGFDSENTPGKVNISYGTTDYSITITPNEGYEIATFNKKVNNGYQDIKDQLKKEGNTSTYSLGTIDGNREYSVTFVKQNKNITITNEQSGGWVYYKNQLIGDKKTDSVEYGSNIAIMIYTWNDLYDISVKVNGTESKTLLTGKGGVYELAINNIKEDTNIDVTYSKYPVVDSSNIIITGAITCIGNKYISNNTISILPTGVYGVIKLPGVDSKPLSTYSCNVSENFNALYIRPISGGYWYAVDYTSSPLTIIIDKNKPKSLVVSDADKFNNWYNAATNIEGTAEDAETDKSGISHVFYTTDKKAADDHTYASLTPPAVTDGTEDTTTTTDDTIDVVTAEVKEATFNKETNKWNFTADATETTNYYIWSYDNASNKSDITTVNYKYDKLAPNKSTTSHAKDVANKDVALSIAVSDNTQIANGISGIKEVYVSKSLSDYNKGVYEGKATKASENSYTYTIKSSSTLNAVYYIWSVDNAGNKSEVETQSIIIDKTEPIITIDTASQNPQWSDGEVTITGTVTDEGGAKGFSVYYCNNENDAKARDVSKSTLVKAYLCDVDANNNAVKTSKTWSYKFEGEQNTKYYFWAADTAGNKSVEYKDTEVKIDTTNPCVTDYKFLDINGINMADRTSTSGFMKIGAFYNKQMKVKVSFKDENVSSGIKDVVLQLTNSDLTITNVKYVNDSLKKEQNNTYTAEFIVCDKLGNGATPGSVSFSGTMRAIVTDNVNRVSTANTADIGTASTYVSQDGTQKNTFFAIEDTKPVVREISGLSEIKLANDSVIQISATDIPKAEKNASGINTISVNVYYTNKLSEERGQMLYHDAFGYTDSITKEVSSVDINTSKFSRVISGNDVTNRDGKYTIEYFATDNAGNVSDTETTVFYMDRTAPYISTIQVYKGNADTTAVTSETGRASDDTDYVSGQSVSLQRDYGYYFDSEAVVKITASDDAVKTNQYNQSHGITVTTLPGDEDIISSGIKSITYYLVTNDGKKSVETTVNTDSTDSIYVTIPAGFKGQIYAVATDKVDNTTAAAQTHDGIITETYEQHNANFAEQANAAYTKEDADNGVHANITVQPSATYDVDGNVLFSESQNIGINLKDTYEGIREITWSVVSPQDTANNQQGTITFDNAGNAVNTDLAQLGWRIDSTDINLVTALSGNILVANNSNNIVVTVSITDRAGNVSTMNTTLSIDMTTPTYTVVYDNNTPDTTYTDIYKDTRTATITVTERNFDSKDFVTTITNTDGVIPALSTFATAENSQNPDATTHTATIYYEADGDYTFNFGFADMAGNPAATMDTHSFTIDRTIPVVNVAYSNNNSANGNYFAADRTATITIEEHNFDASRVTINGTAADDGNAIGFPALSQWTDNGDTHTATISYTTDGLYTFDVEFRDMADNNAIDYAGDNFYIDKTMPALTITGVEDMSANKGSVIPVITYSDTNFSASAVDIKLTGANRGNVELNGQYVDSVHGQVYTIADFEHVQDMDDLYTLTATLTDMAGNVATSTIHYSINRFGSVYTLNDSIKIVEGKYVNSVNDLVITEVNVDTLDLTNLQLKISKNGTPIDLVEGKDYSVFLQGGQGIWSTYTYTINKDLFKEDGKYMVKVYSVDAAGNINENDDNSKKADITFGVDNTAPVIIPINIEDDGRYPVDSRETSISVKDNLVLDNVEIYLNDNKVDYKEDGEMYTFLVNNSSDRQNVRVVAYDAAGNNSTSEVKEFLVTTNLFVRWYNNKPIFIGSIIVAVLAIIGVSILIIRSGKKQEEEY